MTMRCNLVFVLKIRRRERRRGWERREGWMGRRRRRRTMP